MTRKPDKSFRISDASVHYEVHRFPHQGLDAKQMHLKLVRTLRKIGFSKGPDPHAIKYDFKPPYHVAGEWKGLEYSARHFTLGRPSGEIEFFQNIVFENKCGGRYDFRRVDKMPFLIRMRYKHTLNHLRKTFIKAGYTDVSDADQSRMTSHQKIDEFEWKSRWGEAPNRLRESEYGYNKTDKDGAILRPGDLRYYHNWHGQLCCGIIRYNINNMWWVVSNDSYYTNVANFELFSWKAGTPRRLARDKKRRLQEELKKSIDSMNFERAIVLRDVMKREGIFEKEVA